jgi:hypothetical protein
MGKGGDLTAQLFLIIFYGNKTLWLSLVLSNSHDTTDPKPKYYVSFVPESIANFNTKH